MIQIRKKSDTLIIVIHEIYGINHHMQSFCELISKEGFDVICPNLLERDITFNYSQEEVAYHHFMESIGFTQAQHKIQDTLSDAKGEYQKVFIIGFSVGATVAWLCSKEERIDGIVGYYGSRIRNYVELKPKSPTMLIFPEEEQSFHVDELIANLDNKNIKVYKFSGEHGFSDPYSPRYNVLSAQLAFSKTVDFIIKHS